MKTEQFLCGVIEGYYGRPWSFNQRRTLFESCMRFGLNTYVYAPKDDAKHRSRWRELYTAEESTELTQLIHLAKHFGIHFVYALSPGLDMTYSAEKDLAALKRKFDQLSSMGCEDWALLFDDIEDEMSPQDKERFASFAHAQVAVTNQIYEYLNQPNILIFCPTEYCSRMAKPSLEKSAYLQTLGTGLHPDIDIFWTGPKVVSRRITVPHIISVNNVLQRRVTIWDNLNANDYDQRRLCMGPFAGRSSELSSRIGGMLANPNCEFELNFIPLQTLGQWFQSLKIDDDDSIEEGDAYQVDRAFEQALGQWLPEFNRIKSANDGHHGLKVTSEFIDHSPQAMSPKTVLPSLLNDEDSQDSINDTPTSKVHTMECDAHANGLDLTLDDVRLLVELFYLPYEHGPNVQQIFLNFHWLRFNYHPQQDLNEWRRRASVFHEHAKTLARLLQKMVAIHNRALLYDVYNYINDINSTVNLCSKYLQWLDDGHRRTSVFMSGDVEPWSIRGGLAGEFLNILPLGDFQAVMKSSTEMYCIRPLTSSDQPSMYALCTTICYQDDVDELLNQHSEILADKAIGGYLANCLNNSELSFGVESGNSDDRLCGFALTINESEKYDKLLQGKWREQLHQKYPNVDENFFESVECPQWIYDQYSARVQLFLDPMIKSEQIDSLSKKLVKLLIDALAKRGCHGCHALLDERNTSLHHLYLRLGFVDVPMIEQTNHLILVGKQF